MFTRQDEFFSKGIKPLVTGVEKLHVLFATYNTVGEYKTGIVETNKEGLSIQVQNGNLEYSPLTNLVFCFSSPPLADIGVMAMDMEARQAQSIVESELKIESQEGVSLLAVIYAGLSAFNEAVAMAREIKREHPASKVVVTTCDCNLRAKSLVLGQMLESKEIEAVVITNNCGGRDTMRDILEEIMKVWPVKILA